MNRLSKGAFYLFLIALALAPILGGSPAGSEYALAAWGGDSMSGVLRLLVILAALLTVTMSPAIKQLSTVAGTIARVGVVGTAAWMVIDLFVHSRFLTSPVYVFAMVPEVLNWVCFATVFILAIRFSQESESNVSQMTVALLVGGVLCAIVGIMAFGAVPMSERGSHRESATFFSPNFAAGYAALILPLSVALFLFVEGLIRVACSGIVVGLLFAFLMMTGSRAGLALCVVGLCLSVIVAFVKRTTVSWRRLLIVVLVLGLSGFLFRAPMLGRVSSTGGAATVSASSDHSGEFRKETWKGSLAMARANPVFGAGPGTFPFTYTRYARVSWTGQAHSSYLQIASESGFPCLVLLSVGIAAAFVAGSSGKNPVVIPNQLYVSALFGGVIAALGRSVFDSEWILLGCGIPFFAALGMMIGTKESASIRSEAPAPAQRVTGAILLASCFVLTFIVRSGQSERDALTVRSKTDPSGASTNARVAMDAVRPADPQLYSLAGDLRTAAYLSPSGKRLYQFARQAAQTNDWDLAVERFKEAVTADPNNLQTRKALAEAQSQAGDTAGALFTCLDMTRIAEGPAGKIRAIPELPDTLPAFAYTALGEEALRQGDVSDASAQFEKAQQIIEDYSRTPKLYQVSEALTLGGNLMARRAEVRSLYTDRILPGRRSALLRLHQTEPVSVSTASEKETLARLDSFATVETASGP